jgi:hypothetical protein
MYAGKKLTPLGGVQTNFLLAALANIFTPNNFQHPSILFLYNSLMIPRILTQGATKVLAIVSGQRESETFTQLLMNVSPRY